MFTSLGGGGFYQGTIYLQYVSHDIIGFHLVSKQEEILDRVASMVKKSLGPKTGKSGLNSPSI